MRNNPVIVDDVDRVLALPLPWERFAGSTVVVTGAAGFLPAYMVETLLRRNDTGPGPRTRVVGLVRNLPRAVARFQARAGRPDLELVEHDVTAPFRHSGPV
ncbi:MAG: NAD-dependent epimerase/dehydratase family protein, partial [Fimbriiglobus sp.]